MSRKQEFINFLDELMASNKELTDNMSDNVKAYIEALKGGSDSEKPILTDNGKMILKYLQEHCNEQELWKAREIAEGLFISSRTVSGSIRKLVTDGFVEKVSQEPVVYAITEKGKNIVIE